MPVAARAQDGGGGSGAPPLDVISIVNGAGVTMPGVFLNDNKRLELTNAGILQQSRFNVTAASISNSGTVSGMALWTSLAGSTPGNFTIDNSGTITSYIVSSNRVGSIIITDCTLFTSGGGDCIGDAISSVQQGAIGTGQAGTGPVPGGFADGSLITNRAGGLIRDGIRHEGGTSTGGVTVINHGTISGTNTASSSPTVLPPIDLARGAFTNFGHVIAHGARNYRNPAIAIYDLTAPVLNHGFISSGPNLSGSGAHNASSAGGIWAAGVSPFVGNYAGLASTPAGQTPNPERDWNTTSGIRGTHAAIHLTVNASGNSIRSVGTIENAVDGYLQASLAYVTNSTMWAVIFDKSFAAHHAVSAIVAGNSGVVVNNAGVIERPDGFFAGVMVRGAGPTSTATITNQAGARIGNRETVLIPEQRTGTGIRVEGASLYLDNAGIIRARNYGVGFANTPATPDGFTTTTADAQLQFTLRSGSLIETTLGPAIGIKGARETAADSTRDQSRAPIAVEALVPNDTRQSNAVLASQRAILSGDSVIEQNAVVSGTGGGIHLTSLMGHTVTNRGTIRSIGTGTPDLLGLHTGFFETGVQNRPATNNLTLVGGALINEATGTISSARNAAVRMAAGTLINRGTISSTNSLVSTGTITITNGPTVTRTSPVFRTVLPELSGTAGVFAQQLARFVNEAQITGVNYGVWIGVAPTTAGGTDGTPGLTGTFLNSGTIRATRSDGWDGVRIGNVSANGVVRNTGLIEGAPFATEAGVRFDANSTIIPIFENSGDGVTTGIVTGSRGVTFGGDAIIRGVGTDANGNPNRLTGRIEGLRPTEDSDGDNGIRVTGRLMADFNTNATIRSAGDGAAVHIGDGNGQTIRNGGTMRGGNAGLRVVAGAATVFNEAAGVIESTNAGTDTWSANVVGMDLTGISTLINEGLVSGIENGTAGVVMTGTALAGSGTITNQATGTIRSNAAGTGTAILATGSNNITVNNSGQIQGGITLAGGNDLISNSLAITGAVDLGAGDDTYVLAQGGTQGSAVAGGAGTDLIELGIARSATRNFSAAGGGGALRITQFETIRQTGNGLLISTGTLDSAVTLIDVQGGTFANEGTIAAAPGRELLLSRDGTRLDNRTGARIDAQIVASAGELRQTVTNDGIITGNISLGAGDDLVSNRGAISGGIDLGSGNDAYIWWIAGSSNGTVGAAIDGGDGTDAVLWGVDAGQTVILGSFDDRRAFIQNTEAVGKAGEGTLTLNFDITQAHNVQGLRVAEGTLILAERRTFEIVRGSEAGGGYVDLTGVGAVLDNRGTLVVADRLEMRADQTTLINSGAITIGTGNTGSLGMLADQTTLINSGTITVGATGTGSLTGDAGRQTIENSGTIWANVDLGAGDDLIVNSGVFIGQVNMGAGNDEFRWNPLTPPASATAQIDGGLGADAIMVDVTRAAAPDGFTLTSLPTLPGLTSFEAIGKSGDGTLTIDFAGQSQIDTEGLRVSGGTLILRTALNANLTTNAGSGYIELNGVGAVLHNRASLLFAGDRFEMSAENTTLINAEGSAIRVRSDGSGTILGGAGSQTVTNAGTIFANVSLGAGNDRYFLANSGQQFGLVNGGLGEDTAAFEVIANNTRTIVGADYLEFEILEKSGGGTLRITPGALSAARVVILGGRVENLTSVNVTDRVNIEGSDVTWANAPGSSVAAMQGSPVAIQATRERVAVENAGAVSGEVRFTGGDNTYMLTTTGTQTGQVHGGNAAANNRLHYDAPSTGRTLTPTSFVNFERVDLNLATSATGRIVVAAASNPTSQATLDTGGTANSSVTHHRGTLVLQDQGSSLRAHTVTLEPGTRLEGNGTIFSTPTGGGSLGMTYARGTVAPGNSIGTLIFNSNYTPTGPYEVEYRPPPVGSARGRNVIEGSTPDEQDADLIRVSGTAALGGASIVPLRLGTAAQMNTALAASPTGQLRWLVLRAAGGLGGTSFVALSNTAEVRVEYPANGTDVELVLTSSVTDPPPGGGGSPPPGGGGTPPPGGGGTPPPGSGGDPPPGSDDPRPNIVVVTQPPTALTRRDQVLYQQAVSGTAALFDLASDCYRPEGLATALRDEQMCFFAQGRLLQGRFDGVDSYALSQANGDPFDAFSPATGALRLRGADAAIGAVGRIGDQGWLGFVLGFGEGDFSTAPVAGSQFRTRYSGLQLAALARWATGPLELRGMLGYGFQEIDGQRPSALAGGEDRLSASTNQHYATLAGETRYWLGTRGALALAPTMRLHYTDLHRDAYAEAGRSADTLRADATNAQSLRLMLGLTGEIGLRAGERSVILEPRLGWQQELGDRRIETSGEFLGAPGQPVRGSGSTLPRDSALLGLAAITEISPGTRLRFGYDASLANNAYTQAVTLRLSHAW
jgi:hypothetical protein